VLAEVLDDLVLTGVTESPYERDFLAILMDTDLPMPRLQYEVRAAGRFVARVDFAWPHCRLVVEVDGHGFHSSREQRARDATRQNQLTEQGFTVLRFTSDQIATSKSAVARTMSEALRSCVD
jgi:very-short-patch-repair endonuclease